MTLSWISIRSQICCMIPRQSSVHLDFLIGAAHHLTSRSDLKIDDIHITIQNKPAKPQIQGSHPPISEPARKYRSIRPVFSTQPLAISESSQPSPTLLPLHISLKPQSMNPQQISIDPNGQVTQEVSYQ
ncbi:hypothetical protein BLNAU_23998 [Blattamonas nauphoetae]|uniref:Uncharacterized protein n=1 Tax=Blattamonas nauphoetae TaxID=2049346 RepID=A0ABQ9WNP1_9EUKA|nr:hypothetical protein BLNAU_23998 [Blattamonas nauphoetae]